ncbi:phage holin family protein [Fontibacillus panacisegetis]|nr:phage holin family protein [Fontibacillus panacisegetis]
MFPRQLIRIISISGWSSLLNILLVFMINDYVIGMGAAAKESRLNRRQV